MKKLLICILILCAFPVFGNWPEFRGGQHLPGRTNATIPQKVKMAWSFKTGNEIKSSPVVWGDRIVVGSTDNYVYCLDLKGKLQWSFKTTNAVEAPALIRNNTVFIGDLSGMFYALDLQTGKQIWKFEANNQFSGSANWFRDRTGREFIVAGSYDFYLYCFEAKTGKLMWRYEAQNYLHTTPALWNSHAIFGGCDGMLHLVNLANGSLLDTLSVATYIASAAAIDNQKAYIGDYDGKFSCIDLRTRKILWSFERDSRKLPFIGSPVVVGKKVLIRQPRPLRVLPEQRNRQSALAT
jgi:eukaryotic-like serine/threonine-protein kinase